MHESRSIEKDMEDFVRYLAGVRGLSVETTRAYTADLHSYASWLRRSGIDPYAPTHRDLRGYATDLARARYSSGTVSRRLSSLRSFYRWLAREGACAVGTADLLESPKKARVLPKTMRDDDVRALIGACDPASDEGLRDRAFVEFLYASGARISEVSRLDVDDVDVVRMQARLYGKGSKERMVPLHRRCCDALGIYMADARQKLLARAKVPPADAQKALFVSTRGRRMSADTLRLRFRRIAALAGIDSSLGPHAVRHTYATELLNGGADLRSVQELLGHASVTTTQIYTHLTTDHLKAAARQAHPRGE